jgi:penicillin-binding protein 1A
VAVRTDTGPIRVAVRPRPGPPRRRRRLLPRLLRLLVAVVVLVAVLLGGGWVLTPSVDDAPQRVSAFLAAHDAPALSGAVPGRLAEALVATEDSRFRSNPGVDPLSLLRAPWTLVTGQDPGGATLEQQLAKNLYENGDNTGLQKGAELVLALKLDASFSKDEILRLYLDDGYYGHGFYGLTAATEGYFGVAPGRLTEAQASLLAGLFQAPSAYDPLVHPDAARARQAHVLDRLVAVGALTRAQADAVAAQPWGLRTGR